MGEYPKIPEGKEPVICESFEAGLQQLKLFVEIKESQGIACVIVGISGLPGSGKSELCRTFLSEYQSAHGETGKYARYKVGSEDLGGSRAHYFQADCLLIEDITTREVLDSKLKEITGRGTDIYVSIVNMESKRGQSLGSDEKLADIIIHNYGSKGQETPKGYIKD